MVLRNDTLLQVENVSKVYRQGHEKVTALHDVSLSIVKGELLAIVGPSGSGKTTLTHIIGGLITPDTGTVSVEGIVLKKRNDKALSGYRNEKVGFVFQSFGLVPYYTALENVVMPLIVAGVAANTRKERAKRLLKAVGLDKRMFQRVDSLSGGERQRVSIARAMIMQPDIIIADEPTGSLDSTRGNEIMAILELLNKKQGVTVLMVTHDLALAKRARRIIHIRDGRIEKEEHR